MENRLHLPLMVSLAAAGLLTAGGHGLAAPMQVQVATPGELNPPATTSLVASNVSGQAHASAVFQPAPIPDPDIDPPRGASARGPSLTPALFAHKEEFNGDGYASDSDPDHGLDKRRTPAAGLNWSVPVK
jgi:hypothetical protein